MVECILILTVQALKEKQSLQEKQVFVPKIPRSSAINWPTLNHGSFFIRHRWRATSCVWLCVFSNLFNNPHPLTWHHLVGKTSQGNVES